MATPLEILRKPHPEQKRIDRENAASLRREMAELTHETLRKVAEASYLYIGYAHPLGPQLRAHADAWQAEVEALRARAEKADDTCPNCGGHGADPMSDNVNWLPCKRCRGTGRVTALAAAGKE